MLFLKDYYRDDGARTLCHLVKEKDGIRYEQAVWEMADAIAKALPKDKRFVLVPVPGHQGKACYMKDVAIAASTLSGLSVRDLLVCAPHKPCYLAKQQGIDLIPDIVARQRLSGQVPVIIDNVIATGTTMEAAKRSLGDKAVCLAYAKDCGKKNRS